jgi:tetratricopeptide (TPR) repeat protein
MMKCSFIRVPLFATGIAVMAAAVMSIVVLTGTPAFGYSLAEAQSYQQRKDWDGLLRYSKAWSQAEPNNSNAWAMISGAYFFGFNRPDLALEPTKRAVALSPQEAGGWTALGQIHMKLKRYREAVDAFQHSVNLAPENGNHWNNLATAYSYEGDYGQALAALEKQETVAGPQMNYTLWYNLGNGYLNVFSSAMNGAATGSNSAAILVHARHAFTQTLRMSSRYANAWNNLGIVEQAQGQSQNALSDFQQAAYLGDSAGQENYTNLKSAIAAAKTQADQRARCGPITEWRAGCPYVPSSVIAHDTAVFNWNHSYHAPGDIAGRPW